MAGRPKGTPKTGGRKKGTRNKVTGAMKVWALDLFQSEEWRESARSRMLEGKAPHLEGHIMACLMPKTDKPDGDGDVTVHTVVNNYIVDANAH